MRRGRLGGTKYGAVQKETMYLQERRLGTIQLQVRPVDISSGIQLKSCQSLWECQRMRLILYKQ